MDGSARFWSAAALCRCASPAWRWKSGRGLPQSKTLTRRSFTQTVSGWRRFFENVLAHASVRGKFRFLILLLRGTFLQNFMQHIQHGLGCVGLGDEMPGGAARLVAGIKTA